MLLPRTLSFATIDLVPVPVFASQFDIKAETKMRKDIKPKAEYNALVQGISMPLTQNRRIHLIPCIIELRSCSSPTVTGAVRDPGDEGRSRDIQGHSAALTSTYRDSTDRQRIHPSSRLLPVCPVGCASMGLPRTPPPGFVAVWLAGVLFSYLLSY